MSRSVPQDIARYLQSRVREWVQSGKTARELAREAGISEAQVSDVQNSATGAGWKTAESLGRVFKLNMSELIAAATTWATQQQAETAAVAPLRVDAQRRRTLAAELAEEDGVDKDAVRSILGVAVAPEDRGRSTVWWIDRMRLEERRRILDRRATSEETEDGPRPDQPAPKLDESGPRRKAGSTAKKRVAKRD